MSVSQVARKNPKCSAFKGTIAEGEATRGVVVVEGWFCSAGSVLIAVLLLHLHHLLRRSLSLSLLLSSPRCRSAIPLARAPTWPPVMPARLSAKPSRSEVIISTADSDISVPCARTEVSKNYKKLPKPRRSIYGIFFLFFFLRFSCT
ncbi:hypothetical protein PUN28_013568 [Cardiocondyla obscurior]|uniref:Uncharacterized protein n=1 Tax=Cardiocondyla obscurior TaxID=286306 RepID=A0AAW2F3C0_9HYME